MKKLLIIFSVAIVLIAVALSIVIKVYVTPERVKEFIVPAAENALSRKILVGDVSIGLFKGINIKDFAIKEADAKADFLRCKDFVLTFKLLPLLAKKVIIDELSLVAPEVSVIRDKKGEFNFSDIGQKKTPAKAEKQDLEQEATGLPISLLVNKVAVKDARFSLNDFMKELPDVKSNLDLTLSIKSVSSSEIESRGNLDIQLDEMIIQKPSKKHVKDISARINYAVGVNLESQDIRIEKADLIFQKIPASINGFIKNLKKSPEIDIAVNIPKVKTAELQDIVSLFMDTPGMNMSGAVSADMKIKGIIEKKDTLKANGDIVLDKVGINYQNVDALFDGKINFNEKIMNIDIKSTIDKNSAVMKGSVKNYFKNQEINLNLYSKNLTLDSIVPVSGSTDPAPSKDKVPAKAPSPGEAEPLKTTLTARGEVKIDSAIYKGITMSNFDLQYEFKDNKLKVSKMSAEAGRGTLSLNSVIDLSIPGYKYSISGNIDSMHAEDFVNALFPKAKDTVFGTISSRLDMNGAGTLPENVKKNLIADGNFSIVEGKITDTKITENLSVFLNVSELKTVQLKKADGTVKISNGIARLNSTFESDDIAMNPTGNIGLDETLALAFDLKLSPRLTDKAMSSKISQYIKSDEGWGNIPLMISGTFTKPKYTVDVTKAGKRVIEKKVDTYVDKLLDKKEGEEKKELEPVKDLLKGIFK